MAILSLAELEQFQRDGVLTVPNAVSPCLLDRLRQDFNAWVEESRAYTAPYGSCTDGRPRFDLQPGHSAEKPALRRVQAPTEVSKAFYEAMADSPMTDMVADLIGPDVKLHHTKINSKLPGAGTEVKWHQDFCFTPHTNSDVVTALLMIDDVTEDNGPLEVQPGSHTGTLHSIWHDGVFTGAVTDNIEREISHNALHCIGTAGSVCLMHTRLAHGSPPNRSDRPRTLLICVYSAGDSHPCSQNPVPTEHQGLFVRGSDPRRIRSEAYEVNIPEYPKTSFFAQQSEDERRAR
ncbi:MAG: Ectoine dioxygenase [Alphaproteobacteria bacterium MarineAlpha4_Bin2]|nr:MAG: Ectoine dioxygenase [Alphaproteobacteria bacterium MarineAlpha4_Bin2]